MKVKITFDVTQPIPCVILNQTLVIKTPIGWIKYPRTKTGIEINSGQNIKSEYLKERTPEITRNPIDIVITVSLRLAL